MTTASLPDSPPAALPAALASTRSVRETVAAAPPLSDVRYVTEDCLLVYKAIGTQVVLTGLRLRVPFGVPILGLRRSLINTALLDDFGASGEWHLGGRTSAEEHQATLVISHVRAWSRRPIQPDLTPQGLLDAICESFIPQGAAAGAADLAGPVRTMITTLPGYLLGRAARVPRDAAAPRTPPQA